ncbi:MAG: glycosyltransferase [bacterium]|nr:glycosyltransferase [bacterium]
MKKMLISIPFSRTIRTFWETSLKDDIEKQYRLEVITKIEFNFNTIQYSYPKLNIFDKFLLKIFRLCSAIEKEQFYKDMLSNHAILLEDYYYNFLNKLKVKSYIIKVIKFFFDILKLENILIMPYKNILKEIKPDIVYLNCPIFVEEIFMAKAANVLNIKTIFSSDGNDIFETRPLFSSSDYYICFGYFARKSLLRRAIPENKMINVKNYIHEGISKYLINKNIAKQKLGVNKDEKLIVIYEGASYVNGHEYQRNLIDILIKLIENNQICQSKILFRSLGVGSESDIKYLQEKYKNNKYIIFTITNLSEFQVKVTPKQYKETALLVSATDVLFSIPSHANLEFGMFGVPSILYSFLEQKSMLKFAMISNYVKELLQTGMCFTAETEKEICYNLQYIFDNKFNPQSMIDRFSHSTNNLKDI